MAEKDVYIVGGTPMTQKMLERSLAEVGYTVVAADNFREPPLTNLDEALAQDVEVIIVSLEMDAAGKGGGGRQVLKELDNIAPRKRKHTFNSAPSCDVPGIFHTQKTKDVASSCRALARKVSKPERSIGRVVENPYL